MSQSVLDPIRIYSIGCGTAHWLTVSTIISLLPWCCLLGLILDQVLPESVNRIVVRLFPKTGTTRLLTIKVVQGQSAYLEVRSPILSILLILLLRWLWWFPLGILAFLMRWRILSLSSCLRDVGLTIVFDLVRLIESSRLVKLRVFRETLLGAYLFFETEFGIPRWLSQLFLRVPVRTPIFIHRLQWLGLLDGASQFAVLFLVAVGESDGLFNVFFFVGNFVSLVVGGCTWMFCSWLAGEVSLVFPWFLVGITNTFACSSCRGCL